MWELIIGILVVLIIIKIGFKVLKFVIWLVVILGILYFLTGLL
jgi:hypothetical protein